MQLIFFDGRMGSGKTLGMSLFALYLQSKSNCTLYSNYGLKGSKPFSRFSDFLDVCREPSSIICLDESHNDLDSRDYATNSVKYFTHIVYYLRKMRCTLMMTSPDFMSIDSRVRRVTNLYCPVTHDYANFHYPFYDVQTLRLLKKYDFDTAKAFDLGEKVFDTFEMVEPLEYPSSRDEFKSVIRDLKRINREHFQETKGRRA